MIVEVPARTLRRSDDIQPETLVLLFIASAILHVAGEELKRENRELLEAFTEAGFLGDTYSLKNEHEFFACGYERFAMRQALPGYAFDELHAADIEHGIDAMFRKWTSNLSPPGNRSISSSTPEKAT